MLGVFEGIYRRSPVVFQNLMVSVYGWHLHRLRYGGIHAKTFREIMKTQWLTSGEIREIQERRIGRLADFVYARVPYYRRLFDSLRILPDDVRKKEDLSRLPLLTKNVIREQGKELIARGFEESSLFEGHTSGTTGSALTFYKSREAIQKTWAFLERFRRWIGVSFRDRRASFGIRMVVPDRTSGPPYSRYNFAERQKLFSLWDLSPGTARAYFEELERFRPVYIDSYPSAISMVAGQMKENGWKGIRPRAIITCAETLLENQRELLEEQFGCPVYDWYGTSEAAVHAMQCEKGSYHICSEFGVVEILDPSGNPVPAGGEGEIVATCFMNDAQPFLRYRTGDMGILSDRVCPCGRGLEVMERVVGRSDDVIWTPEGRYLGRLDSVYKDTHHIRESQIIQESLDRITVLVVRDPAYTEEDTRLLLSNLREYMGSSFDYDIRFVERIDRTTAGKYRAVISRLTPEEKERARMVSTSG